MWSFELTNINDKINHLRSLDLAQITNNSMIKINFPAQPARDALVLDFKYHPPKKGFSTKEGQARMLHDLASIELQAMELALRSLIEFPEATDQFKEELFELTLSESRHLEMCLNEIQNLGYKWGDWPINCGLWSAVSPEDSLLDRILIVHRYLEGSGLDAGDMLLKRLAGVDATNVSLAVKIINDEEIGHVQFGSRWYKKLCLQQDLDPELDFITRMNRFRNQLPKRINQINHDLRLQSGFTPQEISYLEELRLSNIKK